MYKLYLNDLLLPVAPSKITTKYGTKNKVATLINEGEINILKTPGLTEISFDILLPQQEYPFAVYENGFREAQYFIKRLSEMKELNKPIYLKILRTGINGIKTFDTVDFKCTIENYSQNEDANNLFDITITISFKQYRDYGTEKYTLDSNGKAILEKNRPTDKVIPTPAKPVQHIVIADDLYYGLWGICQKAYGDGSKCIEIAQLNKIANPNKLEIGQVIILV